VGIAPTPAVASIARHVGAAAGVVISASHNPIEDNGIKIFAGDGYKLDDDLEATIAEAAARDDLPRPTHGGVGRIENAPGLVDRYLSELVRSGGDLSSLTVVVDGAYGAAYAVGPAVLEQLGATVIALHAQPDGRRINVACGATDLRALAACVRDVADKRPGAHVVGVAFDGDADRALFVAEDGQTMNGDHVLLVLARDRKRAGTLPGDVLVGTVMANVGLEHALSDEGIGLVRTPVGDRYVLEAMRAGGYVLGGEQSGHIIDLERNTTGDGPMTAVSLLSLLAREGTTLHELMGALRVYPQVLLSVRSTDKDVAQREESVRAAIAKAERELAGDGRILVRPSGTEPVIRVMVEGKDHATTDKIAREIAGAIRTAARDAAP
jgi:phosphoglucosamine mutase